MSATVRIGFGELIDRITILEIKASKTSDLEVRARIVAHLDELRAERARHLANVVGLGRLGAELKAVNRALWDAEDHLREHDARRDFGAAFIELAQSVYRQNDRRSALKRRIDQLTGSRLVEEKLYPPGRP